MSALWPPKLVYSESARSCGDHLTKGDLVRQIGGSPSVPVPGAVGRRIPAFAKKFEDTEGEKVVFARAPEETEPDVRVAKIYKENVDEHGATPKCPGCRALSNGSKYRAKHSDECRTRFEALLSETDAGKKRFDAARERRLEGITRKAMELESKIGTPAIIPDEDADAEVKDDSAGAGGASSGSGMNEDEREASVTAQNVKNKAEAIEESLKMQKAERQRKRSVQDPTKQAEQEEGSKSAARRRGR